MLLQVADCAFGGSSHFRIENIEKTHPEIYAKLCAIQKKNPYRISSQIFFLRRDGKIKPGPVRPFTVYKRKLKERHHANGHQAAQRMDEIAHAPMARPAMPPTKLDADNYSVAVDEPEKKARIVWTAEEVRAVVAKWIELRLQFPIDPALDLLKTAQDAVFAATPERKRTIVRFINDPLLSKEVFVQWQTFQEKWAKANEATVSVVTVEVPKKMTFDEMVKHIDYPSLMAMVATHEQQERDRTNALLRAIAANAGATHLPPEKPFVPNGHVLDVEKIKKKRIVIVGPFKHQFDEIETKAKASGLDLDLRWVDKEQSKLNFGHADYIVITRFTDHHVWNATIDALGKERVFRVEGGIDAVVQKLRDLNSRQ